jgi:hypothetical protein
MLRVDIAATEPTPKTDTSPAKKGTPAGCLLKLCLPEAAAIVARMRGASPLHLCIEMVKARPDYPDLTRGYVCLPHRGPCPVAAPTTQ